MNIFSRQGYRQGSAMVEGAVLLPVYVLLLVGLIYFGNEGLFWQEVSQSARFVATNTQSAGGGSGTPGIANTNGPNVGQDFFLYFQGNKTLSTSTSISAGISSVKLV